MTKTRRPCPTSITRDLEADPSNQQHNHYLSLIKEEFNLRSSIKITVIVLSAYYMKLSIFSLDFFCMRPFLKKKE